MLASGVILGSLGSLAYNELTENSNTDIQSYEEVEDDKNKSWKKPEKYGLAPIHSPEGPIYKIMEPNISTKSDNQNVPVYHVETNSDGFRDEEFQKEPPENTTRILVIGDSFTFGWGLNASERYTDLLEVKMNKKLNGSYQVITAGTPSWGMKDYYKVFKHRGLDYAPDILVVGLYKNDFHSMRKHDEILRNIRTKYNKSAYNQSEWWGDVVPSEYQDRLKKVKQKPISESDLFTYTTKTKALADEKNISVIFYKIYPMGERNNRILKSVTKKHSLNIVEPPRKLREYPNNFSLSGPDIHYGERAQLLLSDKLFDILLTDYVTSSNQ